MRFRRHAIVALVAAMFLLPDGAQATTREIAELDTAPLQIRRSVISELSGDIFRDPYDEFQRRPFNLAFANLYRTANMSPWPGQEGEQLQYVNALIGNNGATNVRNGADVLEGMYIRQKGDKFHWGVSAGVLTDQTGSSSAAATQVFNDSEELGGFDLRFAMSYRLSERMMLGGGVRGVQQSDKATESTFDQGVGGFFGLDETQQTAVEADFGIRHFLSSASSWDAMVGAGLGRTEVDELGESTDAGGNLVSRLVITRYEISSPFVQLSGGYNRRFNEGRGEWQARAGYRMTQRELDNSDLSFSELGGVFLPLLTLLEQEPVSEDLLFLSAGTVFVRGQTQFFAGSRLGLSQTTGSSVTDSLGTLVSESIDDTSTVLNLNVGVRQPLWSEKIRLLASARADWVDSTVGNTIDTNSSTFDASQTTTGYAIGVETVLNNMVFDLAWVTGEAALSGSGTTDATRQTIDLDRLVISATLGW